MSAFSPSHTPPVWWERVLQHGAYVVAAAWSVVVAVQIALDPLFPKAMFSISLGNQPWPVAVGLGLTIGLGGVAALFGILTGMKDRSWAWSIEKAGWWLLSTGWVGYSLAVFLMFPGSSISWGSSLAYALAGLLRVYTLVKIEDKAKHLRSVASGGVPKVAAGE